MMGPPEGMRAWLAAGPTDMRKGFDGLAALVQQKLARDPFAGQVFVFRGRRGDLIKALWWDGQGRPRAYAAFGHGPSDLFAKRLERGRFVWPSAAEGVVVLSPAPRVRPSAGPRTDSAGDAARRDRLADAGAHLAAAGGRIVRRIDSGAACRGARIGPRG